MTITIGYDNGDYITLDNNSLRREFGMIELTSFQNGSFQDGAMTREQAKDMIDNYVNDFLLEEQK